MMKKILTLLITIAITSNLVILPVSAKILSKDEHSWRVVNGLGLADYLDSQKEEKVTRAEFAKFLVEALGIISNEEKAESRNPSLFEKAFYTDMAYTEYAEAQTQTVTQQFADVSQGNEFYDAIYALKRLGIMTGDGSGNFYPDQNIKCEEVLKTFIVLVSYNVDPRLPGIWPYSYIQLANDLNIGLNGVAPGAEITKQQLLRIFYKLFDVEMIKMTAVVDGRAVYETKKGVTFLNEVIGLYCFDGRLDATANSTVYLPYTTKSNSVIINSITYGDKTHIPLGSMLGRKVEAYRTEDGDVVYMTPTDDDEVKTIAAEDINGCTGGILSYEKNGRLKTTDISGLPVIYNGVAITSYDEALFDIENGNITLIEGGGQDIVSVWSYKNMHTGSVVYDQYAVYDQFTGYKLELDENDNTVHIFNLDGSRLSFEDLTAGKNISYIENGSYKELYVYDGQINGVVKQISPGSGRIKIEAEEYSLTDSSSAALTGLKIGTTITAYVDMFGKIFFIERGKIVGENIGYLVKAFIGDDEEPMLKMYCKDGEFINYFLADKVKFTDPDNNSIKVDGRKLVGIIDGNSYSDVCMFFLNTDERISKIQFALNSKPAAEDKLYKKYFNNNINASYDAGTGMVSYSLFLTAGVKIYEIPDDKTDYENYNVRELSELKSGDNLGGGKNNILGPGAYAYYMDDGIPVPRALVIKPLAAENNFPINELKLVTKVGNLTIDEDDRICIEAEFITAGGVESTSFCVVDENGESAFDKVTGFHDKPEPHKLSKGDIVFCVNKQDSNELSIIRMVFSANLQPPTGESAKKGWMVDVPSNLFQIKKSSYEEFKKKQAVEGDALDILSYISYSNASYIPNQNPMKISGSLGRPLIDQPHLPQAGTRIMLGYAVDLNRGYLKLTTQDLSVSSYDPDTSDVVDLGESIGVKFERYFNILRQSPVFQLVEIYDNGIVTRRADPTTDILTYKQSGRDCSRVLIYNDTQYFIINDYRRR